MGQSESSTKKARINGFCDERFLPVKKHLEDMLQNGAEENVQLCVYHDGQCVIDLWGTAIGDTLYNEDKIQVNIVILLYKTYIIQGGTANFAG